jgi:hypothetical protein
LELILSENKKLLLTRHILVMFILEHIIMYFYFFPYQIINLSLDLQCHPTWLMKKKTPTTTPPGRRATGEHDAWMSPTTDLLDTGPDQ